jgi:hypothetical protein
MRRITEVLRLAAQGLSYRLMARAWASARPPCRATWHAPSAGVDWPLPDGLDAAALERGCSRVARARVDLDAPSQIGERCIASARAASTSRSSCCIWSTSRPTPTAGVTPSSAPTTTAGSSARTSSCASSTRPASACSSISVATRCRSPIPTRVRCGKHRFSSRRWRRAAICLSSRRAARIWRTVVTMAGSGTTTIQPLQCPASASCS